MVREVISHPAVDYSEGMTAEEQKRYINYLAEHVREADLGLRARDAVLQDFLDKQREYDERLSKLDEVLSRVEGLEKELALEVKMRKSAERKVSELTARLRFADKDRFGDKRQRVKKKGTAKVEDSDRGKDEEETVRPTPPMAHIYRDDRLSEHAVRPLTIQRNSMLHFGSDEGARMAATYHSIISTVKIQGRSAWDYLGKFFVNIFNGCRDFLSLRPDKIGLATYQ